MVEERPCWQYASYSYIHANPIFNKHSLYWGFWQKLKYVLQKPQPQRQSDLWTYIISYYEKPGEVRKLNILESVGIVTISKQVTFRLSFEVDSLKAKEDWMDIMVLERETWYTGCGVIGTLLFLVLRLCNCDQIKKFNESINGGSTGVKHRLQNL